MSMRIAVNKTLSMVVGIILLAAMNAYGQSGKRINLRRDLVYLGAFKVPPRPTTGMATQSQRSDPLTYGGELLTFNPYRNSLYIMGSRNSEKLVYEISIPAVPINSPNLSDLPTATFLSGGFDITGGIGWSALTANGSNVGNGGQPGGLLFMDSTRMVGNAWAYYDGPSEAVNSHFVTNSTLSNTPNFRGYYAVGLREDEIGRAHV